MSDLPIPGLGTGQNNTGMSPTILICWMWLGHMVLSEKGQVQANTNLFKGIIYTYTQ